MKKILIKTSLAVLIFSPSVVFSEEAEFWDANTVTISSGVAISDINASEKTLFEDDTLPQDNIGGAKKFNVNLGAVESTITKNDKGLVEITDSSGNATWGSTYDYQDPRGKDATAEAYKLEYKAYVMDDNLTSKRARATDMKKRAQAETSRRGNTVKETRQLMLSKKNPLSEGPGIMHRQMQESPLLADDETGLRERDQNITKIYNNVDLTISSSQRERIIDANIGVISELYNGGLDAIITEMTNRLASATIKCIISRELTPSFYCPIASKAAARFPGSLAGTVTGASRNLDIAAVKRDCDAYCHTEPGDLSCIGINVPGVPTSDVSIGGPFTLFPESGTYPKEANFTGHEKMPIEKIVFEVEFPTPSSLTDEEWATKLKATPLHFMYSITDSVTDETNYAPAVIADKAKITVNSALLRYTVPVDRIIHNGKIEFWRPFFTTIMGEEYKFSDTKTEYTDYGISLRVKNLKISYASNEFHYCMAKQMVYTQSQCEGGVVQGVASGDSQFNYLCKNSSTKIGPEPDFGGFYSSESCEAACIEYKPCVATYSHYNSYGTPENLLKSEVKCLDSDSNLDGNGNSNCSDDVCKAFFTESDEDLRPINEYLVANDDTFIYTIRNSVLTDHARPKINLSEELQTNPDFDQIFIDEEKDASFLYMIKNITYNRNKYLLGTESPANLGFIISGDGDHKGIHFLLKPNSEDYNDGVKKLYAVLVTEHQYHPIAGSFTSNNQTLSTTQSLVIKDITYAIKTSEDLIDSWQVFRVKNAAMIRNEVTETQTKEDGTTELVQNYEWGENEPYLKDNWVSYDSSTDNFLTISENSTAPSFKSMEFDALKDYFKIDLTSWIEHDIQGTPGMIIRNQLAINHNTDIKRIYNEPMFNHEGRSYSTNYWMYLTYSDVDLSYKELLTKLETAEYVDKIKVGTSLWTGYELTNSQKYTSNRIKYDGEINNGINTLKKGSLSSISIGTDWEPSVIEKGKRVFKFIFLFDEADSDIFDYSSYVTSSATTAAIGAVTP